MRAFLKVHNPLENVKTSRQAGRRRLPALGSDLFTQSRDASGLEGPREVQNDTLV